MTADQPTLTDDEREALARAARAEVANAFMAWAAKNEIAKPPLDWTWFGEIARRYSPLHEEHDESGHPAGKSEGQAVTPVWTAPTKLPLDTAAARHAGSLAAENAALRGRLARVEALVRYEFAQIGYLKAAQGRLVDLGVDWRDAGRILSDVRSEWVGRVNAALAADADTDGGA